MNKTLYSAIAFTAAGLIAGSAEAGIKPLLIDTGTEIINSGWGYDAPEAVTLYVSNISGNTITLNKQAEFGESLVKDGYIRELAISFVKIDVASTITNFVIDFEEVTNATGKDWSGFRFAALNGASFDQSLTGGFGTLQNESDAVFSEYTFGANGDYVVYDGEGVKDGTVWQPGLDDSETQSDLVMIHVGGDDRFWVLKEQPIADGGPGVPPPVIPLPAAAWSGIVGLAGLGLMKGLRRVRKNLA